MLFFLMLFFLNYALRFYNKKGLCAETIESWNFAFEYLGELSAGYCNWLLASRYFQLPTSSAKHFWECPGLITSDLFRLKFFFNVFLLT